MASDWTHAQCERCWIKDNTICDTDEMVKVRMPTRVLMDHGPGRYPLDVCCYCKELTIGGIYVRHDPALFDPPCDHIGDSP